MAIRWTVRLVAELCAGLTAAMLPWAATATDFPDRPLQMVVPFAAGGGLDQNARSFAQAFAEALKVPVAVVNRDGAAGSIGMQAVASARADGYTMAFTPAVPLTSQPHRVKSIAYRLDAFEPVCQVFDNIFSIVVRGDSPWRSVADMLADARQRPGAVSYGTSGTGSIPHLGGADIESASGVQLTHVPYKGDGPMLQDLLGGELGFGAMLASSVTSQLAAGRLRLLAVFSETRHPGFPDVPTLGEAGVPVVQASFGGVLVPAGTAADTVRTLERACRAAIDAPVYQAWAQRAGQVVDYRGSADFGRRLAADSQTKAATLKRLGL